MARFSQGRTLKVGPRRNKLKALWMLLGAKHFIVVTDKALSIRCSKSFELAAATLLEEDVNGPVQGKKGQSR